VPEVVGEIHRGHTAAPKHTFEPVAVSQSALELLRQVRHQVPFIQPVKGVRSKTRWYQAVYTIVAPLSPILLRLFPQVSTTTARLGRALIQVAAVGYSKPILYSRDINVLGATA
jgi:hypothetical protein